MKTFLRRVCQPVCPWPKLSGVSPASCLPERALSSLSPSQMGSQTSPGFGRNHANLSALPSHLPQTSTQGKGGLLSANKEALHLPPPDSLFRVCPFGGLSQCGVSKELAFPGSLTLRRTAQRTGNCKGEWSVLSWLQVSGVQVGACPENCYLPSAGASLLVVPVGADPQGDSRGQPAPNNDLPAGSSWP